MDMVQLRTEIGAVSGLNFLKMHPAVAERAGQIPGPITRDPFKLCRWQWYNWIEHGLLVLRNTSVMLFWSQNVALRSFLHVEEFLTTLYAVTRFDVQRSAWLDREGEPGDR
jgi:hypothetical protein